MTDYFDHIDDYLTGRLSDADRQAFETAMLDDEQLRKAVDNHDVAAEAMDLMLEDDIRGIMAGLDAKDHAEVETIEKKAPGYKTFLLGLLLATLLALIAYLYKSTTDSSDPEMLYAAYYSDYMSPEVRGNDVPTLTPCNRGHQLMQENQLDQAKKVFIESLKVEDDCTDKSQWYLTLIYLKERDRVAVDSLLTIITKDQSSLYNSKAIKLQSQLQ